MTDFDRCADTYGDLVQSSIRFSGRDHAFFLEAKALRLLALARRYLGDLGQVRGLDVGCGDGAFDSYLTELGSLHGVDVSESMVERARAADPGRTFRVADGTALPFDDATFDLVFTVCVLHHVPPEQRARFASELCRVTRPGGLVVVFEHNPWNPLTRLVVARCVFDEDAILLRRAETSRLFLSAGARPVEHRYLLFTPWRADRVEGLLARVPLGAQYYAAFRV